MYLETLNDMINDRKYKKYEETNEMIKCTDRDNNIVIIYISDENKFGISSLEKIVRILEDEKSEHCILIYKNIMTGHVPKAIQKLDYNIEIFKQIELNINPTKHILTPKHEKVEDPHKIEELKRYNIPSILDSDPVSRYYRYLPGDYIKITRKDGIMFRKVKSSVQN